VTVVGRAVGLCFTHAAPAGRSIHDLMDRAPTTPDTARRRPRWAVRVSRGVLVVAVAGSLAGVGCQQIKNIGGKNEKQDLLEAELRTREREVLELRAENQQLKQLADIYVRGHAAGGVVVPGPVVTAPVGAVVTSGSSETAIIRSLTLATGTGGRDDDGLPGDEMLQVVISPRDADGTAVKVPGRAVVTAFDILPEGQKVPIGRWDVTGEQLRKAWKGGLLGSGYFLPLSWDLPPTSGRVRVAVVFASTDGRTFEADRDVTVKPLPGLGGKTAPPTVVTPGPTVPVTIPGGSTPLPPPKGVELPPTGTVLPPPGSLLPVPEFPK
jgi:hypothetical protein